MEHNTAELAAQDSKALRAKAVAYHVDGVVLAGAVDVITRRMPQAAWIRETIVVDPVELTDLVRTT